MAEKMSNLVRNRVRQAAQSLRTANPLEYVGGLIDRSFSLPVDDGRYVANSLAPGNAPFESSFSEGEPHVLRFTLEPLGPDTPAVSRREEATHEMRRLVNPSFGPEALRWFDQRSEEWRGFNRYAGLHYGAWFGSAFDQNGLSAAKVYYELSPGQAENLPEGIGRLARAAGESIPDLVPMFTSIACRRESGNQRVTYWSPHSLRLNDLEPLMSRLGMAHQLPSLMQIAGLVLGGRFELPAGAALLGVGHSADGPELKLEILLDRIPDLPASFLNLLALGLSERPRKLQAMNQWLNALSPESLPWPADFSVLSVRVTPRQPARVALYLRPAELSPYAHAGHLNHSGQGEM